MFRWLLMAVCLHRPMTSLDRDVLPSLSSPAPVMDSAGLSAIRTITGIMEVELCKERDCSNGGAICPADA
jgi:hypothetical protein